MAGKKLNNVRNIGIMAHIDAGKTTVSERVLFYSGRTYKIAEVHDGQATMDFMDQERERGITISSAVNEIEWRDHHIYLIDTPGHVDFTVEVERSLRVLDGVIALFDAVSGVEPQSETVWFQADRHKVARMAFVNKMDRVGADMDRCVSEIQKILGGHTVVIQEPIFENDQFVGVIDLIDQKAFYFEEADQGSTIDTREIPASLVESAQLKREQLVESLADVSDEVAELFLEGEEVPSDLIRSELRKATIALKAVPVLCGSGLRNKGIQPLMDAVVDYLPAPDDLPPVAGTDYKGKPVTVERSTDAPFTALAYKLQQIEGKKLIFIRIYSGTLSEGDNVQNATQKNSFKIKHIFKLYANRVERVPKAQAGELVAILKAKATMTGDTLCDPSHVVLLERIEATAPVISISIEPESIKDKDKLSEALSQLHEEDPTVVYEEDEQTGELLLRGMGELHLDIICERLKREFNIIVRKGNPTVVCKETIRGEYDSTGTFERQTDTESIYGSVDVHICGLERGKGEVCKLSLPEDAPFLKQDILDAAVSGARDAMVFGPRGNELVDLSVEITRIGLDAKGQTSVIGTRAAAAEAVRQALRELGTIELEPLMQVDVVAAEEHIGDLIADLTQRGGVVEDIDTSSLRSVIHSVVPLKNMFGYTMKLRTLTHGRGSFSMRFKVFDSIS